MQEVGNEHGFGLKLNLMSSTSQSEKYAIQQTKECRLQVKGKSEKFSEKVAKLDAQYQAKLVPAREISLDRWQMDGEAEDLDYVVEVDPSFPSPFLPITQAC